MTDIHANSTDVEIDAAAWASTGDPDPGASLEKEFNVPDAADIDYRQEYAARGPVHAAIIAELDARKADIAAQEQARADLHAAQEMAYDRDRLVAKVLGTEFQAEFGRRMADLDTSFDAQYAGAKEKFALSKEEGGAGWGEGGPLGKLGPEEQARLDQWRSARETDPRVVLAELQAEREASFNSILRALPGQAFALGLVEDAFGQFVPAPEPDMGDASQLPGSVWTQLQNALAGRKVDLEGTGMTMAEMRLLASRYAFAGSR